MWERILRLRCKPNQLWWKCREDFLPVTAVKRNSSRLWRVSFLGIKINSHIFRLKDVQFLLICWQCLWYRLMFTADSRFLIWFAFWFNFFFGTVHVCFICLLSEMRGPFISFLCFCVNLCRPNWVFSPLASMFHQSLEIRALYIYRRQTSTISTKAPCMLKKESLNTIAN